MTNQEFIDSFRHDQKQENWWYRFHPVTKMIFCLALGFMSLFVFKWQVGLVIFLIASIIAMTTPICKKYFATIGIMFVVGCLFTVIVRLFETLKWSGHQPMNLNEYMNEHVYMYSSENAFVKFRIVKAMISDVIDLFGKGVNFSEETDTHVSVSVHVNERAAEQFAKNYAPDVVILQPKRLRDKLRDDLKKAWEAYED